MLQKVQQNKWLRLGMGVLGGILMAAGINLIVVPQGMYSGGLYGLCQVIRTLLVTALGLETSVDLAGIFYLLVNLPLAGRQLRHGVRQPPPQTAQAAAVVLVSLLPLGQLGVIKQ